jgi:hAT family C-terminal dimerisation region
VDNPSTSRKQDELTRYLKFDHHETSSNDVLEFWSTMADYFPTLTKVAFQILTIPATSANVERSFSAAGQVVSEKRSNISPDLVNDILFLRSAKK